MSFRRISIAVIFFAALIPITYGVRRGLFHDHLIVSSREFSLSETVTPISKPTVTLVFAGDIMLGRNVGAQIAQSGDWRWPFLRIASTLQSADIAFANLEGPISERGVKSGSIYSFRFDPRAVAGMIFAGFDVLSIANNHLWDYGRTAFMDTLKYLNDAGINPVGGGADDVQAYAPAVRILPDGTRVAYFAYTEFLKSAKAGPEKPGIAFLDEPRMIRDIAGAKTANDIVIVSFHMGDEYQTVHNVRQEALFHEAVDAGADMVVGHHPHVVQDVERYKNAWIAYSLGNFVFDQNFSAETMHGLMLRAIVLDHRIDSIEQIPVEISPSFQPYLLEPPDR